MDADGQPMADANPDFRSLSSGRPNLAVIWQPELLRYAQLLSGLIYAYYSFPAFQRHHGNHLDLLFCTRRILHTLELECLFHLYEDVFDANWLGEGREDQTEAEIARNEEIFAVQVDANGAEAVLVQLSLHVKARRNPTGVGSIVMAFNCDSPEGPRHNLLIRDEGNPVLGYEVTA